MLTKSKKEVEDFARTLWPKEEYRDAPDIDVDMRKDSIDLKVSAMYEAPGLSFAILKQLSAFFETDNIHDERFDHSGCETCDYGSDYGFTLTIR